MMRYEVRPFIDEKFEEFEKVGSWLLLLCWMYCMELPSVEIDS